MIKTKELTSVLKRELKQKTQWPYGQRDRAYQNIGNEPGIRNMDHRYSIMQLPASFENESVLDIGCNAGAACLEAKKRGAKRVVGVDYKRETIEVAKKIAEEYGLDIEYYVFNVNEGLNNLKAIIGEEKFDCTFALSIWDHVNKHKLSDIINFYTKKLCWFEGHASNTHGTESEIFRLLKIKHLEFLGKTSDRNSRLNYKLFYSDLKH